LRLVQLDIYVDGKRVVQQKNAEGLKIEGAALMHHGSLFPGTHQVRVELVYTGKPGLFSYMEAYKFKLRPMTLVNVSADKPVRVKAVAYDRGAQYEFESRPDLKYIIE
jgi:hypothetical protein